MSEQILRTHNLGKKYRRLWAVKNLNLEVNRGDVFGFLGPNGAGKSTTIRMILSLIRPTVGEVEIFGYSLKSQRLHALRSVSGIVEKPDFYSYLSGYKNLEIVGGLTEPVRRKRIAEMLELVGLADRGSDKVKTYSHGMKQRLGIAQALISDPELVILDEPTNGLDPQGMKDVRELILHLSRDQKKTIILSSHLLSEVEMVANRMAIIHKGELVVQGKVQDLLYKGEKYIVLDAEPRTKVQALLKKQKNIVRNVHEEQGKFYVHMEFSNIPELTRHLVQGGVQVKALIPRRSLEDLFLSITENAG